MYTKHPYVNSPSDNAVLWRYMDFAKFMSILDKKTLFLARPDELGDRFEASLTHADVKQFDNCYPDFAPTLIEILKVVSARTGISSWHENDVESEAMWRLYSREKNGIAIKTYGNCFKECMKDEREIYIGRINYIDYQTDLSFAGLISSFFCKRLNFKHEQEVRAVYLDMPEEGSLADFPEGFDGGICYKVDLSLLIQEVVVAPSAEDWFVKLIKSIVARYGLEAPVHKSNLAALPVGGK